MSGWIPKGGGSSSPLTTKGDVWGYDSADARIPIGSDGQVLTADSGESLGLKWAAAAGGGGGLGAAFQGAAAKKTSDQTGINGSATITWDDTYWDTDSFFDNANDEFDIPTGMGGYYLITFHVQLFDHSQSSNAWVQVEITSSNDNIGTDARFSREQYGVNFPGLNGSVIAHLDAGDQVSVSINSSDTDYDVRDDGAFFSISRLDPYGATIGDGTELTIATGAVTATSGFHTIDTESDASTDDLDTINGGTTGDLLVLKSAADARDPTLKDGTGNLRLAGDFTLSDTDDTITLIYDGSNWCEVSRSNNA